MKNTNSDRPLVTFALFAYNQEQYIREAVEGAFAQTYEPLEIILSDDCSSDRTFEIMCEMAREYRGPHRVKVRRTQLNAGLSEHINDVARIVQGKIIVLAAGDDISSSVRTEAHVEIYMKYDNTFAVFSDYNTFPDPASKRYHFKDRACLTDAEIIYNGGGVQIGATYSYRRECLSWPSPLPSWLTSEDRLLPFRAALLGNVRYISDALVLYRVSNSPSESRARSRRILGLNNAEHFPLLWREFCAAAFQGKISLKKKFVIGIILKARSGQLTLERANVIPRGVTDLAFSPLRLARKIAVLHDQKRCGGGGGNE